MEDVDSLIPKYANGSKNKFAEFQWNIEKIIIFGERGYFLKNQQIIGN